MRDNNKGLPEIIEAFSRDGHYFAIIKVILNNIAKSFEFGLSEKSYS